MEPTPKVWNELYQYYCQGCGDEEWEKNWFLYRRLIKTHWQYEDTYCKVHSTTKMNGKSIYRCFPIRKNEQEFGDVFLKHFPDIAEKIGDFNTAMKAWKMAESKMLRVGCIFYDDTTKKYLITQSSTSHKWSVPQGKIDKDENYRQCAAREIKEELGYDIDSSPVIPYCIVTRKLPETEWIYYVIVCNYRKIKIKLDKREVNAYAWRSFADLKNEKGEEYSWLRVLYCFFEKFEKQILKEHPKPKGVVHFTHHSDSKLRQFMILVGVLIDDKMTNGLMCIESTKGKGKGKGRPVIVDDNENDLTFGANHADQQYSVEEIMQKNAMIEHQMISQYDGDGNEFGDVHVIEKEELLAVNPKPYFSEQDSHVQPISPSSSSSPKLFAFDYERLRNAYLTQL